MMEECEVWLLILGQNILNNIREDCVRGCRTVKYVSLTPVDKAPEALVVSKPLNDLSQGSKFPST